MPDNKQLINKEKTEKEKEYKESFFYLETFNNLLNIISLNPGMKVLDIGCGLAKTARFLANAGGIVTCIDISSDVIEKARKSFNPKRFDINFKRMDVHDLHLPENHFDLVICNRAIEFFKDPRKAYKEMRRVSKKYGVVVISLLNPEGRWSKYYIENYSEEYRSARFLSRNFLLSLDSENIEMVKQCFYLHPNDPSEDFTRKENKKHSTHRKPEMYIGKWRKDGE